MIATRTAIRRDGALTVDAVRLAVLREVFDGDPHAWVDYLLQRGSPRQIEEDLPFAIRLAMVVSRDAG
jgi:hypothetical protein